MQRQITTKNKAERINSSSLPRGILQRKCACGNQAAGGGECVECGKKKQLLQRRAVHVSEPGDRYEQEADRVAEQVMRMPEQTIQHQVKSEKEGVVQRKATANSITPLQPSSTGQDQVSEVPPIVDEVLRSPGQPLDSATKAFMEPRFGHDFGKVRLHTDDKAGRLTRSLDANAFTVGFNIVFAKDLNPANTKGKHLLAHELTHVIQQRLSGRAKIALQPAGNLTNQASEVRLNLSTAKTKSEFNPLIASASNLADSLISALQIANNPNPAQGALSKDDAREGLKYLVRGLITPYSDNTISPEDLKGLIEKAVDIVSKSNDSEVLSAFTSQLIAIFRGVDSQQRLIQLLATLVKEKIAPPGINENSAKWLDKNTNTIGKIFQKLNEMKCLEGIEVALSHQLLNQYFEHVEDRDVKPDPSGNVSFQTVNTAKEIEADCDVYATYATRLLRQQGWQTVGYLVIVPHEKKIDYPTQDRDAHAVALAKKPNLNGGWLYIGVSNDEIEELSILSSDDNALVFLFSLARKIYAPPLRSYDAYYLPANSKGELDLKLLKPVENNLKPYDTGTP